MANLKEAELLSIVNSKQVDAENNRNRIQRDNEYLEKRYNAEYYGTEVPGRSRFVSNDVKDACESAHDSLVRMFLGAGPVIKFTASNPEDKKQQAEAQEKTEFIDWLVRGQTNSYKTQSSFLTEVLKFKAGVQKYTYEETESTEDIAWEGLTIIQVAEQLLAIGFELTLKEGSDEAELITSAKTKSGKVVSHNQNDDGTFDIKVRIKTTRQKIKLSTVPTGSFLLSSGAEDLDDAELVGDESFKTRGELVAEGHSQKFVSELPSSSVTGDSTRVITVDSTGIIAKADFSEWASQLVPISDLYVKVDYNQDGIAERRHIQKSNDFILHNEPFDHVPYATASALIVPNQVIGEGWGEQVVDIQEVNTAITRGTLDNIYAVNNTKKAVRVGKNGVNLDEALSPVIGGVVQVTGDRPLTDMIQPLVTEFIGDKALLIKQHMDQMKSNRVGGQLTSQGLDGDSLSKETATRFTGVEKTNQAKIEKIARNIVEMAYRKIYEGVAWTVAHYEMDEVEFNVLGKSLTANPANWKYDSNVDTEVGLGAGDNEKVVQNMSAMYQIHLENKAAGSPLTDEKKGYNILRKMYKALDVKDVSLYVNDPEEPAEQLRFDNEQLNALAMQQQQAIEQLTQQVTQLQALSEVELVKAQAKAESDNKSAALGVAQLQEDARQFNITAAQKGSKQNSDEALEITKLELDSQTDLPGGLN
jgi:hypothetical protein